ncbi:MAG: FHA domain-containing protein [Gammaproteobacteria bacterium]
MPPEAVTLRCSLNQPRERTLEVTTPRTDETAWLDRLRRQGLEARFVRSSGESGLMRKAVIAIQGSIPASLRFSFDFDNAALQLVSRNFEELSERRQIFKPEVVTEQWCEQLLKYVLREPNSFMRYEVPRELREQLQRRIEWERRKGRGATPPAASAFGLGAMLRIIGRKARLAPAPPDEPREERGQVMAEAAEETLLSSAVAKKLLQREPRLELRYRGKTVDLTGQDGPFHIGRSPDCHLWVDEQHASRAHAFIELRDGRYHLTDASRNGTYVRFADGRTAHLRNTGIPLAGAGRFALGIRVAPGNRDIIGFVAGPPEDGPSEPEQHP